MSITPERLAEIRERDRQQTIFRAVLDRRELLAEVTGLRAALNDYQNKAETLWRWLREARRENADLRAKGGQLAAENQALRAAHDAKTRAYADHLRTWVCHGPSDDDPCRAETARLRAELAWLHMASVGPNGEGQHGGLECPPPGSRP